MKSLLPAALAAILGLSSPALAQSDSPTANVEKMMTAPGFVMAAGASNLFEIQSSELALQRSTTPAVQSFAQQMIADHTNAGKKLDAVLAGSNSAVTPPKMLDARHQALLEQLSQAEGERFDAEYIRMQVQAHQEAVALFTAYADGGDDAKLRAFATETLPVLRHHYEEVRKLAGHT
jgi:putative membrane protein